LKAAQSELEYGEWLRLIKSDLPFTASTAQRLMKIAADPRLADAAHGQLLPAAWRSLYELTQVSNEDFLKAVATGKIHPKMKRSDVRTIRVPIERRTIRLVAPNREEPEEPVTTMARPVTKPQGEAVVLMPHSHVADKLEQIRAVIAELKVDIRDDSDLLSSFEGEIRKLADQLLSLVSPRRMAG
jgi:hypothetical protein